MNAPVAALPPRGGIVPSLIDLYQRLASDEQSSIAQVGYSTEKVYYAIVLRPDGTLVDIRSVQQTNSRGKEVPRSMLLFDSGARSGTKIKPNFLWDNTGYVLGADDKGNAKRSESQFEAFRTLHQDVAEQVDDDGLKAVATFLHSWKPDQATTLESWDAIVGKNVVFQIEGVEGFVHQSRAIRQFWNERPEEKDKKAVVAPSLVDGKTKTIARLHPAIRGVAGAGTTGAAIVSFNQSSFESYGKSQSYNAPLGEAEAFQYTTALNYLLADSSRRVQVGDATMVFWTDSKSDEVEDLASSLFAETPPPKDPGPEDIVLKDRLHSFLKAAREGTNSDAIDSPNAGFYVLGLSPNKSRLSVRFWWNDSVATWAKRLAEHVDDLSIVGLENDLRFSRSLVAQTVRDPKESPPELAGAITRSILQGFNYPDELWRSVVRRCRIDRAVSPIRAGILKACMNRSLRLQAKSGLSHSAVIEKSLVETHSNRAYQLGRLLGVLDLLHVGSTDNRIKESAVVRSFSTAIATPACVLPRLMKLSQFHRRNLPRDPGEAKARKVRTQQTFDRNVADIVLQLDRFPTHLSMRDQACALLGFYQQRQRFFQRASAD
ncbi:type I-C CRISPR-associated protein Cas8c/Csd1 [Rhodopirellula sp. MGV]|uniref:type I-C CRISPR-associated protein Cas8c/Csd1 n=1 Tax=Rhodopirellula sp. MGV TaxID=2023130 RepID=UPI0013047994|nr:type I-C CRISPR-associated protein Cas8c/Csd1 [Rhodopirellula sp. MGV]